jgi:hypothetical protein
MKGTAMEVAWFIEAHPLGGLVVGGVDPDGHDLPQRRLHLRVGERPALELLAGGAPRGVEVDEHGLARLPCEREAHGLVRHPAAGRHGGGLLGRRGRRRGGRRGLRRRRGPALLHRDVDGLRRRACRERRDHQHRQHSHARSIR